jgi:hypothetical protein
MVWFDHYVVVVVVAAAVDPRRFDTQRVVLRR